MSDYYNCRPVHGECKHFQPDKQRTGMYRLGTCEVNGKRYERCDFCDRCKDFALDNKVRCSYHERTPVTKKTVMRDRWFIRVRHVASGRTFESINAAAKEFRIPYNSLADSLKKSLRPNGRCACHGKVFEFCDDVKFV